MTKSEKMRQVSGSKHRRAAPYPSPTLRSTATDTKKRQKASEKKDWHDATCSVCMEHPHNAVLLLCSSHHKGCRPYMCATSSRYSNCLDQYKKAYTKVNPTQTTQLWDGYHPGLGPDGAVRTGGQVSELLCPLCRGQVKGWTVVEPARKYLDSKKRSCTQDGCSFVGSYRALRKHVRAEHPRCCPREVDPSVAEKWKELENDREMNDVMSTISSTMPGSVVMGDYVIEGGGGSFARDGDGVVFRLGSYGGGGRRSDSSGGGRFFEMDYESWDDTSDEEDDVSDDSSDDDGDHFGRHRGGGFRLGPSGRRYNRADEDDVSDSSSNDDGGRIGRHRGGGLWSGSGVRRLYRPDDVDRTRVSVFGVERGVRLSNHSRESYHRRRCTFGGLYGGLRRRSR